MVGGDIMAPDTVTLPIRAIRLDFQPPECLDPETVHRYVMAKSDGEVIAPVRVYFDGEVHWLADRFHRVAALQAMGLDEVEAEVVPGTYADMEAEWNRLIEAVRSDLR